MKLGGSIVICPAPLHINSNNMELSKACTLHFSEFFHFSKLIHNHEIWFHDFENTNPKMKSYCNLLGHAPAPFRAIVYANPAELHFFVFLTWNRKQIMPWLGKKPDRSWCDVSTPTPAPKPTYIYLCTHFLFRKSKVLKESVHIFFVFCTSLLSSNTNSMLNHDFFIVTDGV